MRCEKEQPVVREPDRHSGERRGRRKTGRRAEDCDRKGKEEAKGEGKIGEGRAHINPYACMPDGFRQDPGHPCLSKEPAAQLQSPQPSYSKSAAKPDQAPASYTQSRELCPTTYPVARPYRG